LNLSIAVRISRRSRRSSVSRCRCDATWASGIAAEASTKRMLTTTSSSMKL
jgi:hypothetical protein